MVLFLFLLVGVSARLLGLMQLSLHGERTPHFQPAWGSPESQPPGHLTEAGHLQQVAHGEALKANYSELFTDSYSPMNVYARAIDGNSTVESLRSQLRGIYGDAAFELQVLPDEHETVLLPLVSCLRITHIMTRDQIPAGRHMEIMDRVTDLEDFVRPLTGSLDLWNVYNASEVIVNYLQRGAKLPCSEEVAKTLELLHDHVLFNLYYGEKQQVKLGVTPLLLEVLSRFHFLASGDSAPPISLYVGEAVSLVPFLRSFEIKEIPGPGAFLQIELHVEEAEGATEFFLRFRYNGQEVSLSNCEAPCTLSAFEESWQRRMYRSEAKWLEKCARLNPERPWPWKKITVCAFGFGLFMLLMIMNKTMNARLTQIFKRKVE